MSRQIGAIDKNNKFSASDVGDMVLGAGPTGAEAEAIGSASSAESRRIMAARLTYDYLHRCLVGINQAQLGEGAQTSWALVVLLKLLLGMMDSMEVEEGPGVRLAMVGVVCVGGGGFGGLFGASYGPLATPR